jgi:hypothetical protein
MEPRLRTGASAWICAAAAALLLAATFAAAPALATEDDEQVAEGACREECGEARRVCHRAAHAGYKFCWDECEQTVAAAVHRARDACDDRDLGRRECARLVDRSFARAARECREDCRRIGRRARGACREERHECRRACAPPLDAECVAECRDEFGACRDDLGACRESCAADAEAALQECRELVSDSCDAEAFRECVHQARSEARACVDDCHEENACAGGLRECLGDCAEQAEAEEPKVE